MPVNKIAILQYDKLVVIKKNSGGSIESYEHPLDDLESLGKDYIIVLPDSYVNLIYTDLTFTKTKKLREIVKAYLMGLYPEELLGDEDFGFLKTPSVIAYLLNNKLKNINKNFIENAHVTTTPSLIALQVLKDKFIFTTKDTILLKNGEGFIHIIGKVEGIDTPDMQRIELKKELLIDFIEQLPENRLNLININLPNAQKTPFSIENFKLELILFPIVYCLLVASFVLNIIPVKKEENIYHKRIDGIYKQMKLENNSDPYGMLLFKLGKLKKEYLKFPEPLKILSAISEVFEKGSDMESITANQEMMRIKGKTSTLDALNRAIKRLGQKLGVKCNIESVKVKDNFVEFVISGKFK